MCDDAQQEEIIINKSNMPVVRSGFSNIIFFLLIIFLILINQILNDFDIMNDDYGWATVVRRIIKRSTQCGHFLNVSPRNLRRFE